MQIFEKALDEPKYSSLYAQLCHRLFKDAPNFEPPDSSITVSVRIYTSLLNKWIFSFILHDILGSFHQAAKYLSAQFFTLSIRLIKQLCWALEKIKKFIDKNVIECYFNLQELEFWPLMVLYQVTSICD